MRRRRATSLSLARSSANRASSEGGNAIRGVEIHREGLGVCQGDARTVVPPRHQRVGGRCRAVVVQHGVTERTDRTATRGEHDVGAGHLGRAARRAGADRGRGATRGVAVTVADLRDVRQHRIGVDGRCVGQCDLEGVSVEVVNSVDQILREL